MKSEKSERRVRLFGGAFFFFHFSLFTFALPVELGFEYRNGLTLKELSEIEGSHVLNSCDDPDNWVIVDHPSLPGYSGKGDADRRAAA